MARRAQPRRHHRRDAELLQQDELPHRLAQDRPRTTQAQQALVPRLEGALLFTHAPLPALNSENLVARIQNIV